MKLKTDFPFTSKINFDRNAEKGKEFAQRFNVSLSTSLEEAATHADVDAVYLCVPTAIRGSLAKLV
jgi:predicted dehydrogenase